MESKSPLLDKLKRFVRHRERQMNFYGAYKTLEKMTVVSKLLKICDLYRDKNDVVVSRVVLQQEEEIRKIMPGRSSEFYDSDYKKLIGILDACKQNLSLQST